MLLKLKLITVAVLILAVLLAIEGHVVLVEEIAVETLTYPHSQGYRETTLSIIKIQQTLRFGQFELDCGMAMTLAGVVIYSDNTRLHQEVIYQSHLMIEMVVTMICMQP